MSSQQEFDEVYITSSEICKRLRINRSSIVQARARGVLPDPILVNGGHVSLWKRSEVQTHLAAWEAALQSRRGERS